MALETLNADANLGQMPFFQTVTVDAPTSFTQNDIALLVPPLGRPWKIMGLWFQVPEKAVTGADVDIDIRVNSGDGTNGSDIIDGYAIDENDNTYVPVSLMGSIDEAANGIDVAANEWVEVLFAGAIATLVESIVFAVVGVFQP